MRFLAAVLVCVLLMTAPAWAGAWLRTKGGWFSSTSSTWDNSGRIHNGFYAEYGLRDWLTIGVDAGVSSFGAVKALFFTRTSLLKSDEDHKLALEVAAGTSAGRPVLRPGLSYGRGLATPYGSGWLAIDAVAAIDLWSGTTSYKVDSTVGLSPSDSWKTILQFQTEVHPGLSHTLKIAPSVVRRVGKRTLFEVGVSETVLGGRGTAIKVGFWLEF